MQRESGVYALNWCEKTMSVLKERQLEACEKRLADTPSCGLFSGCTDIEAQTLWDLSFYARENPGIQMLHSIKELQQLVLCRIPREAALVSVQEHQLLERLLLFEGETELMDWEETGAAEALVARLWCTLTQEDDRILLHLAPALQGPLLEAMNTKEHLEIREQLFRFDATIHGLLYIAGFLHAQQPLQHFLREVARGEDQVACHLARRYLCAAFDYTQDNCGEMILVHPGLADPEHLLRQLHQSGIFSLELNEGIMLGGMNGIFPEEVPLYEAMCGVLNGAVRPEYTVEEAVVDLRILAKQGVPLPEMEEVLSSMLIVHPTPDMLHVLKRISAQTPRWAGLSAGSKN